MGITHAHVATGTDAGTGEVHKAEWNADHAIADSTITPAKLDVSADNTTANATSGHHGLLPKLSGDSADALHGDGTWGPTSPFVNVQVDYGAVGDDSTDDTAAIQAAFDDHPDGATIYFPPGTYKITSALTITSKRLWLLGAGDEYGPSIIKQHTANTDALHFDFGSYSGSRIEVSRVSNLLVQGPATGASPATSGNGIWTASDVNLDHVGVSGFYRGVLWQGATYYSSAYKCFVSNCVYGFFLDNCNNITIDTCRITGKFTGAVAPCDVLGYGVRIDGGLVNRIVNSSIEYWTQWGVFVTSAGSFEYIGNYQETGNGTAAGNSMVFVDTTTGVLIAGSYFQVGATHQWAIDLATCTGVEVSGNLIQSGASGSIRTRTSTAVAFLMGNKVTGTKSLTATTYDFDATPPLLSPMTTEGDLIYQHSSAAARLGIGASGRALVSDGTDPAWTAAGGDVTGGYSALTVGKLQGRAVASTAPTTGQRLVWDGSAWTPTDPSPSGVGEILVSDSPAGSPLVFTDLIQNEAGTDLVYADPGG